MRLLSFMVSTALCGPLTGEIPRGAVPIKSASAPSLSPDGRIVVFEWARDIWEAPSEGGRARRLTTHPAQDSQPLFSSDGKTLYFNSTREGARQLFSMPAGGGPVTRHTFHSDGALLEDVARDGSTAVIRGVRDEAGNNPFRLIEINLREQAPERMWFDVKAHSASLHPDGTKLLFCRDGESPRRKGYRGPRASSIWLFDRTSGLFDALVKEDSSARDPIWKPDGLGLYYVSDRDGTFNLWSRESPGGEDTPLTRFEGDGVISPALSADGETLVFSRGLDLWIWHPDRDGAPRRLDIWHTEDRQVVTEELRRIQGTDDADFSKSGLEMVFAEEGVIWAMDTVLRSPRRLSPEGYHCSHPRFSPDGVFVYYLRDDGLRTEIRRMSRERDGDFWWRPGALKHESVVRGPDTKTGFQLSPDGTKLAYETAPGTLNAANADGSSPRVLIRSTNPLGYDWSPDGRWLAVAAQDENFNRDIHIVPADGGRKPFNISRHPGNEWSPKWSPNGRMIAFIGRRDSQRTGLFHVHLRLEDDRLTPQELRMSDAEAAMLDDPFYNSDEEEEKDEPATVSGPGKARPETKKPAEKPIDEGTAVRIDFEDISERIRPLHTGAVVPAHLIWSADSKSVMFQSAEETDTTLRRVAVTPGSRAREITNRRGKPIRADKNGSLYWIVDRAPAKWNTREVTRYPVSTTWLRPRAQHQRLGFRMIWRTLRDRFYDDSLNGLDWSAIRRKYEDAAAGANDSTEFQRVVGMLLGELNASHLTFQPTPWPNTWSDTKAMLVVTRHPGLRFESGTDGRLTVREVLAGGPADACEPPIGAGDVVLSINGSKVDAGSDLVSLFNGQLDEALEFKILHADGSEHSHAIRPIRTQEARALATAAQLRRHREKVERESDGRLGYIHIARMFQEEFEEFQRQVFAAGYGREGLVIDIRDNTGGFIADRLLTILTQPRHAVTVARGGHPGYPQDRTVYAFWNKPIVVVCNRHSFSNAEVFAHAVKTLGRGQLVGEPTAGGVISTIREPVLDLGQLGIPFRGWFNPDTGEDYEMRGAAPDHLVQELPGEAARGYDRQLSKAVAVLLEECDQVKRHTPFKPAYRSED